MKTAVGSGLSAARSNPTAAGHGLSVVHCCLPTAGCKLATVHRRLRACICVLLAAVLLGACGGGGATGSAAQASSGALAEPYTLPPASAFSSQVDESLVLDPDKAGFENHFLAYRYPGEVREISFRLYLPPEYSEADGPLPLFIYLHGMGERGGDNTAQLNSAVLEHLLPDGVTPLYPCIVLAPQCPAETMWFGFGVAEATVTLIEQLTAALPVDADRVYLAGVSMGGMGAYSLMNQNPALFAGAVTICGGQTERGIAEKISGVPLWAFHAADDSVASVADTRRIVKELEAPVQYTEYETGGHEIWEAALADDAVFEWLYSQQK